jgi:hypothetical protein
LNIQRGYRFAELDIELGLQVFQHRDGLGLFHRLVLHLVDLFEPSFVKAVDILARNIYRSQGQYGKENHKQQNHFSLHTSKPPV